LVWLVISGRHVPLHFPEWRVPAAPKLRGVGVSSAPPIGAANRTASKTVVMKWGVAIRPPGQIKQKFRCETKADFRLFAAVCFSAGGVYRAPEGRPARRSRHLIYHPPWAGQQLTAGGRFAKQMRTKETPYFSLGALRCGSKTLCPPGPQGSTLWLRRQWLRPAPTTHLPS